MFRGGCKDNDPAIQEDRGDCCFHFVITIKDTVRKPNSSPKV